MPERKDSAAGPIRRNHPRVGLRSGVPVPSMTRIASSQPAEPPVGIVILNWNKSSETLDCLKTIKTQTYRNRRAIIIDNGSEPESIAELRAGMGAASLICNPRNLGFAGGVNVGIRAALDAGADYVWLLNSDALAAPDTLAKLVAAMERDTNIGLASPVIRNIDQDNSIIFCGGVFDMAPLRFHETADPDCGAQWQERTPGKVYLFGTALMLRRTLVESIGMFDENLFAYAEDSDYSIRSAHSGFYNKVVFDAEVFHRGGNWNSSTPHRQPYYYYYATRNGIILIKKYGGVVRNLRSLVWLLNAQTEKAERWHAIPEIAEAISSGIVDGLRGVGGEYVPKGVDSSRSLHLIRFLRRLFGLFSRIPKFRNFKMG